MLKGGQIHAYHLQLGEINPDQLQLGQIHPDHQQLCHIDLVIVPKDSDVLRIQLFRVFEGLFVVPVLQFPFVALFLCVKRCGR